MFKYNSISIDYQNNVVISLHYKVFSSLMLKLLRFKNWTCCEAASTLSQRVQIET